MLSRNKKLFIANFAFAGYEGPGVILLYNGALSGFQRETSLIVFSKLGIYYNLIPLTRSLYFRSMLYAPNFD